MATLGPVFSETSFAFAFTENLVNCGRLTGSAAPQFLSTYAEGRGKHWDALIPTRPVAFFFQFKIPEVLQRGRTLRNGIRLEVPFYRMNLRSESGYAQHHGLLQAEAAGDNIYYVCSRFHEADHFDRYYRERSIHENSVWFRPSQITPPDFDTRHGVVYDESGRDWEVRSNSGQPHRDKFSFEDFLNHWNSATGNAVPSSPMEFIGRLSRQLDMAIEAAHGRIRAAEALGPGTEFPRALARMDPAPYIGGSRIRRTPSREKQLNPLEKIVLRARAELGLEILLGGLSDQLRSS